MYLDRLPHQKSYITPYRAFCEALAGAENPVASVEVLDRARNAVASRADFLNGRNRRRHHPERAKEVDTLQTVYRELVARMLAKGWR